MVPTESQALRGWLVFHKRSCGRFWQGWLKRIPLHYQFQGQPWSVWGCIGIWLREAGESSNPASPLLFSKTEKQAQEDQDDFEESLLFGSTCQEDLPTTCTSPPVTLVSTKPSHPSWLTPQLHARPAHQYAILPFPYLHSQLPPLHSCQPTPKPLSTCNLK